MLCLVFLIAAVAVDAISAADDEALANAWQIFNDTELPPTPEFSIYGPPINKADLLRISEDESIFDRLESIAERKKKCSPSISCQLAGGYCVKSQKDCDGTTDTTGCRGNRKCSCCIPAKTTPAPPTCPPVVNITCPAVTVTPCQTVTPCPLVTPCPTDEAKTTPSPSTCPPVVNVTCPAVTVTPCQTVTPCPSDEGCPDGFFVAPPGSRQCLKFISDTPRTWTAAKTKCEADGLVLAKPNDPVAVRRYLWTSYEHGDWTWIGAKSDGSNMRWDRDTVIFPSSSPLWFKPQYSASSDQCMILMTNSYGVDKPTTPYATRVCTRTHQVLCELIKN